ncbi:heat-inducible transcriptional repressor HrcA [Nitratidesulfovibrio vulgaris]|uniref:Heat-inducible transcription repressor HrcA n=1 Tax=Nitratidesulfovibrio vulgaris (strain ATCC 29579 / DSM 644 / CCUG 34227 / NCIMB 8303 / VKM B-1760 / Hildenborough) TaxID=882 RepID=HRCA_NITV2|nr:heat-inducible transcriptional repressor HrcA [Nitratidesulfovibrio vulgaris]Q72DW6.1 RecName: Full=Heat-inducible transcription repressor HrcA [Nitratidesulfovibrio vulgaris str. Hildenborough]AAS95293.1 heat-inducible transcription repressor HrcA [Nitratidesulfovibrio vulgaris str. Hildenborough]ADP85911.1 heat-inducible transcription repressor HrcA [Nitratidesulfovibrio vulgaris RCH1]
MSALGSRETHVLTTIIESYITSAAPVGSRTVSRRSGLALSPASMRNTMSDLTDMGFLEQPHTSAGRIPTPKAFRLYVDALLRQSARRDEAPLHMVEALHGHEPEVGALLRRASNLVSEHARQVSMVLAPGPAEARLRSLDFVPAGEGLVLAVLVLEGGMVRTRLVRDDTHFGSDELVRFGNYINAHYRGHTLSGIRNSIHHELSGGGAQLEAMCAQALALGSLALDSIDDDRELYVNGTRNILDQAEFAELGRMRELMDALEERSRLLELLDRTILEDDVHVTFYPDDVSGGAQRRAPDGLRGCSMVSAPYGGASPLGVIGVIGPVRMDYRKVLPLVGAVSRVLTQLLRERFATG